ncbi:RLA class II histocompatibility antigen, DP alpha-1 chain-like isoform X2 [Mastacembelus armatus]|uniref:RLA class II histocompatibility antigen, DP alpha-1 chain-like isoform X2 n=1 Tax=Mastacembelus armatus TaxID=205130 RepID=UPI000E45CF75|nr:RLA class II histocompatibility antigen, DP alpha-1 chain-like isoform X2 [Mastacembelus armatus]
MTICSSDMKRSAVLILILNTFCAFSQTPHELVYYVGCFVNGTIEIQSEFDAEMIFYIDFQKKDIVYTVPTFLDPDPTQILVHWPILRDALTNKELCLVLTKAVAAEEKYPAEERDPPESILFPSEEIQLGVENSLICFVNHFYPPSIKVSWTKNGHPVSEEPDFSHQSLGPDIFCGVGLTLGLLGFTIGVFFIVKGQGQ